MVKDHKEDFSLLLKDALTSMYRVSLRLTRDHMEAEDLVAEASLKAWEKFSTLRNHQSFKFWILKICQNLYITKYRKQKSHGKTIQESKFLKEDGDFSLFDQLASPLLLYSLNPEKEFLTKISSNQINNALDVLPEKYKSVVMLCCLEDIPYQQTATILGLPIGTVRSRLHRGKAMLQKSLWELGKEKGYI